MEDVKEWMVGVTKLVNHTGSNVCLEETVDGEAEEVAVGERIFEAVVDEVHAYLLQRWVRQKCH